MIQKPAKNLPDWIIDKLPEYNSAQYVPQRFNDSTHDLWRLELNQQDQQSSSAFLKICQNTESPFWRIMGHLFGFNLTTEIGQFDQLYASIDRLSPLEIPQLFKAQTIEENKAYILTSELAGSALDEGANINLKMVQQLAEHLASLHQNLSSEWGTLSAPKISQGEWPGRLAETLSHFSKDSQLPVPDAMLQQALSACNDINVTSFVPMMPDLRWDQFHQHDSNLFALVDLDAFILAPVELDLVLLEYIISAEQSEQFIDIYEKHYVIPDIGKIRPAYRLLLYLMQVLGEQDIELWMNAEVRF